MKLQNFMLSFFIFPSFDIISQFIELDLSLLVRGDAKPKILNVFTAHC